MRLSGGIAPLPIASHLLMCILDRNQLGFATKVGPAGDPCPRPTLAFFLFPMGLRLWPTCFWRCSRCVPPLRAASFLVLCLRVEFLAAEQLVPRNTEDPRRLPTKHPSQYPAPVIPNFGAGYCLLSLASHAESHLYRVSASLCQRLISSPQAGDCNMMRNAGHTEAHLNGVPPSLRSLIDFASTAGER